MLCVVFWGFVYSFGALSVYILQVCLVSIALRAMLSQFPQKKLKKAPTDYTKPQKEYTKPRNIIKKLPKTCKTKNIRQRLDISNKSSIKY